MGGAGRIDDEASLEFALDSKRSLPHRQFFQDREYPDLLQRQLCAAGGVVIGSGCLSSEIKRPDRTRRNQYWLRAGGIVILQPSDEHRYGESVMNLSVNFSS